MFALRYWCRRFFASRYWPKFGASLGPGPEPPIEMTYRVPKTIRMTYDMDGDL